MGTRNNPFYYGRYGGKGYGLLPATGQRECYDAKGNRIPRTGSHQDGEFRFGFPWPKHRFEMNDEEVTDRLTGLCWLRSGDLARGQVTWEEAFKAVSTLNSRSNNGSLWRLPNINELESLVDCSTHSPALPSGHPFREIRDSYWSSTTSLFEPDWAWALYLTKGAVGVGQKKAPHFCVWPVRDPLD